jgi:hypothetical protein
MQAGPYTIRLNIYFLFVERRSSGWAIYSLQALVSTVKTCYIALAGYMHDPGQQPSTIVRSRAQNFVKPFVHMRFFISLIRLSNK